MWWVQSTAVLWSRQGMIINLGSLLSILVASRSAPAHHRAEHAQNVIGREE